MPGRGLELAGDLPKVQPQLRKLHIVEKPKKRYALRNAVFVGGTIAALLQRLRVVEKPKKRHALRNAVVVGTIAGATLVAVVVWWRQGGCRGVEAGDQGDEQAGSAEPTTPDAEPDQSPATDADAPQDIAMPVPA